MVVFRRGCVIFLLEYFIKISFVVITDSVHNLVYGFIRVFQHGFRMFQTDLLHIECSITGRYLVEEYYDKYENLLEGRDEKEFREHVAVQAGIEIGFERSLEQSGILK